MVCELHLNDAVKKCREKKSMLLFFLSWLSGVFPVSSFVALRNGLSRTPRPGGRALKQVPVRCKCNSRVTYQLMGKYLCESVISFTNYESVLFRVSLKKGSTLLVLVSGQKTKNKRLEQNTPPRPSLSAPFNSKLCNFSEFVINTDYKWYFSSSPISG